jgi:hypothetical protein
METRRAALAELEKVFAMIADEYRDKGPSFPPDSTEILHV